MTAPHRSLVISLFALLYVLTLPCGTAAQSQDEEAQQASLRSLDWMAGHWVSEDGLQEEVWLSPIGEGDAGRWTSPGMLLGMHRDRRKPSRVFFEYLRIELREGIPCYIAQPMGGRETEFCMTEQQEHSAVFSNPLHDFPQHIHYELRGDTLHASISGESAGRQKTTSWSFIRKAAQ